MYALKCAIKEVAQRAMHKRAWQPDEQPEPLGGYPYTCIETESQDDALSNDLWLDALKKTGVPRPDEWICNEQDNESSVPPKQKFVVAVSTTRVFNFEGQADGMVV